MKQTIIDILKKELKGYETDFAEFEQIKNCLAPLDGSRITAHLQKKLPPDMKLEIDQNKAIIKVEKTGNEHKIARASNKVVDVSQLEDLDCAYSSAADRVQKLKAILENEQTLETFISLCINLKKGYDLLKTSLDNLKKDDLTAYYNPAYSQTIKAMNIPWDVIRSID